MFSFYGFWDFWVSKINNLEATIQNYVHHVVIWLIKNNKYLVFDNVGNKAPLHTQL
jgi:hypothetical protein